MNVMLIYVDKDSAHHLWLPEPVMLIRLQITQTVLDN